MDVIAPERYGFLSDKPEVMSVIKIGLVNLANSFSELNLKTLRFYLNIDPMLMSQLYQLIFWNFCKFVRSTQR